MKKPKIRFNGYTEDWEQRKFDDVVTISGGHTPSMSDSSNYDENGTMWITSQDVKQTFLYDSTSKLSAKGLSHLTLFPEGTLVLVVRSGILRHTLPISMLMIPSAINQDIKAFSLSHDIINIWMLYLFQANERLMLKEYTKAGTTVESIDVNHLKEYVFSVPLVEEQRKIGVYFRNLDNLITLHQRKCEQTKKLKKFMLQKMFPKKDEKTPEIRFSEFTDAWEQRKLRDEATEMFAGGDIDKEKVVENGKYPIYANALTNDGIVGYYDDYYRVKAPAVTVTGRGDVGHAQARTTDFTPVVRLLAIRSEHNIYFLENTINNHGVVVESTGVPQLTVPQLGNYTISFPDTIEEETKLGEYFHRLDTLITLHLRKCEELKEIKKFMLQNMFV